MPSTAPNVAPNNAPGPDRLDPGRARAEKPDCRGERRGTDSIQPGTPDATAPHLPPQISSSCGPPNPSPRAGPPTTTPKIKLEFGQTYMLTSASTLPNSRATHMLPILPRHQLGPTPTVALQRLDPALPHQQQFISAIKLFSFKHTTSDLSATGFANFEKRITVLASVLEDAEESQQPSKNSFTFTTREKRTDAKKALKDLLFKTGSAIHNEGCWNVEEENCFQGSNRKTRQNKSGKATSRHSPHAKKKQYRKNKSGYFSDENPEKVFQATFGNRCFTWSSGENSHFQRSTTQFDWRDYSDWKNNRRKSWDTLSDAEDEDADEQCVVGSCSDRSILGLPPTGPIKIEDVKCAFRSSALKWHPDKYQGPSQAMAGEKFKLCVDAYKSLCSALSSA
ncbi:hypothetical protein GIB67_036108 [Kingdonia uniflora]|uniref:J domain-containing protein n=1 Tax=Kingdonia uniflora TaxID=39325 RepID=A0A7J7N9T7_9MAGN|nr:hypothetical protein GIB67_036108 [Kingdonia uniflora]